MWNIFKETGNIEAYLYVSQYNNHKENHHKRDKVKETYTSMPLELEKIELVN